MEIWGLLTGRVDAFDVWPPCRGWRRHHVRLHAVRPVRARQFLWSERTDRRSSATPGEPCPQTNPSSRTRRPTRSP